MWMLLQAGTKLLQPCEQPCTGHCRTWWCHPTASTERRIDADARGVTLRIAGLAARGV